MDRRSRLKRTRHGRPIGLARAWLRALRRATRPWRRRLRRAPDPSSIQRRVALAADDRPEARRRWHVLVDLIAEHGPPDGDAVVVELGTYQGECAAHVHRYCPRARIVTVDVQPPDPARDRIRGLARVEFVRSDSAAAAQRFDDGSVDALFVDADHAESAVLRDLQAWVPKVRPGGVIAGHDYATARHPGVTRAVDAFFAEPPRPIEREADKVWWTLK